MEYELDCEVNMKLSLHEALCLHAALAVISAKDLGCTVDEDPWCTMAKIFARLDETVGNVQQ